MNDQEVEQLIVSVARKNHIQISRAPNGPLENVINDQWFYDYRPPKIVLTFPHRGLEDFVEVTGQTSEILEIEIGAAFDRMRSRLSS